MHSQLGQQKHSRGRIVNQLLTRKNSGRYRVLDLGGQPGGWSDAVVDLYVNTGWEDSDRVRSLDLCRPETWSALDKLVSEQGQFDYCICTHTLEDLVYPFALLEGMSRWAQAGFIAVPSLRTELSNPESLAYRGFIHHLWLIDADSTGLEFTPKFSTVNHLHQVAFKREVEELQIDWQGRIAYTQIGARGWDSPQQIQDWLQGLLGRALELQR